MVIRMKKYSVGYLMIAPAYAVYLLFILIPVLVGLYYSFTNYNFYNRMDFIGLKNYTQLFQDEQFGRAAWNTFVYSFFTIIPQVVFGLLFAALLNGKLPGRVFARGSIYLPHVTSMVAVSMVWLWIYDPSLGILNRLLGAVGFDIVRWLYDPSTAMGSLILMGVWKSIGFNMVVYLAALQGIPASLYEASFVDGASRIRQFFHITVPLLRPATFFLIVTSTVNSFAVFEQVNIMTGGGPLNSTTTIVHQIYLRAFQDFRMGYASAMAMLLLLVTVLITLLNFRYGNQGNDLSQD